MGPSCELRYWEIHGACPPLLRPTIAELFPPLSISLPHFEYVFLGGFNPTCNKKLTYMTEDDLLKSSWYEGGSPYVSYGHSLLLMVPSVDHNSSRH